MSRKEKRVEVEAVNSATLANAKWRMRPLPLTPFEQSLHVQFSSNRQSLSTVTMNERCMALRRIQRLRIQVKGER